MVLQCIYPFFLVATSRVDKIVAGAMADYSYLLPLMFIYYVIVVLHMFVILQQIDGWIVARLMNYQYFFYKFNEAAHRSGHNTAINIIIFNKGW